MGYGAVSGGMLLWLACTAVALAVGAMYAAPYVAAEAVASVFADFIGTAGVIGVVAGLTWRLAHRIAREVAP